MRKAARKAAQAALRGISPMAAARAAIKPPKRDESKYHKGSCDMRRILDPYRSDAPPDAWAAVQPGDFWFGEEAVNIDGREYVYSTIWAKWPDGCMACLPLEPVPEAVKQSKYARATWGFDGNLDRPTLTPSVHHVGHWHGWVRAGRMVSV